MKKLPSLALYALIAPAVALGMGSALAQTGQSKPDSTAVEQGPTEREKGPHVVTVPAEEGTAAETEADYRAQQQRADEDAKRAQSPSQDAILDQRTAQDTTPARHTSSAAYLTSKPANSFRVDQLIGSNLKSRTDGETIGSISDLLVDEDGQIVAVIVGVGSFLGMGEKDVAIPWDSVERSMNEEGDDYELRVSASKDALTDAPEFKSEARKE